MIKLYKLIAKTNFKSPIILFPFVMPLILMLMYSVMVPSSLNNIDGAQAFVNSIFFTLLSITIMQSGLMGVGFNFMNLKKSVMLRRIGATKMNKSEILGAFLLYGLTIFFINIVWAFAIYAIIDQMGMFWTNVEPGSAPIILDGVTYNSGDHITLHIDWSLFSMEKFGKVILVIIIGALLSYGIGFFFVSISDDINKFQGLVSMYFFGTAILGGMMIPSNDIEWMQWVGLFLPHVYFSHLFDWAIGNPATNSIINQDVMLSLDFIIPIVVGIVAFTAAVKFLKFE